MKSNKAVSGWGLHFCPLHNQNNKLAPPEDFHFWASATAWLVKAPASKPDDLSSIPGPSWWKVKLSPDLHTAAQASTHPTPQAYTDAHTMSKHERCKACHLCDHSDPVSPDFFSSLLPQPHSPARLLCAGSYTSLPCYSVSKDINSLQVDLTFFVCMHMFIYAYVSVESRCQHWISSSIPLHFIS